MQSILIVSASFKLNVFQGHRNFSVIKWSRQPDVNHQPPEKDSLMVLELSMANNIILQ